MATDVVFVDATVPAVIIYTLKNANILNYTSSKQVERVAERGQTNQKLEDNLASDSVIVFEGIMDSMVAGLASAGLGDLDGQEAALENLKINNGLVRADYLDGDGNTTNYIGTLKSFTIKSSGGETKTRKLTITFWLGFSHEFVW